MGEILYRTRLSEDMFRGLSPWMARLPGGLVHTNIVGCTVFAAVSGSSAATLTTVGKMSVPELRTALEAEGLDFEAFRLSMRDEIVIRRLRSREVTSRIQVTKSEIDSYLERSGGADGRQAVYLMYILIATPDGASPETREAARIKATQVVEQLQGGADFRRLAQQVSDSSNALQGGDLGWIEIDRGPPLLQTYGATMHKGETRGPIAAGLFKRTPDQRFLHESGGLFDRELPRRKARGYRISRLPHPLR